MPVFLYTVQQLANRHDQAAASRWSDEKGGFP